MKKPGPPHGPPAPSHACPRQAKSKGSKSPRPLSEGESKLWRHAASTMQPLKRAKGRVHAALENQGDAPAGGPATAAKSNPANRSSAAATTNLHGKSPGASATAHRPVPLGSPRASPSPQATPKPPPLADFDAKRARKLRSGQVELDARIDLHGMRQAEAHVALRGFLHASLRKGHRVVLVITGKGAPAGSRPEGHWGDTMGRSERGILRRSVPQWLSEPDLRAIVVSYTTAAVRHGGDGALYVHLRRLR